MTVVIITQAIVPQRTSSYERMQMKLEKPQSDGLNQHPHHRTIL